jgi:hypothetical protein
MSQIAACFHAGFLLGLFFHPEDGGDMFLRTDHVALYPRRQNSSSDYNLIQNFTEILAHRFTPTYWQEYGVS